MRLKCIGGDNHGKHQDVPNNYRDGDVVRLAIFPKVEINCMKLPEEITAYHYDFYVVETLKYSGQNKQIHEFKFLRHGNINLMEALMIALVY